MFTTASLSKSPGTVYWITGLSGAGKTTIGTLLTSHLRVSSHAVVCLDGDALRAIFSQGDQYSLPARLDLARRYGLLCQEIACQGVDVVCCTISMFDAVRQWNRDNIVRYVEVYLRVPVEELRQRDYKKIYASAAGDVVGMDIVAELPKNPDVIIDNVGAMTPGDAVTIILATAGLKW